MGSLLSKGYILVAYLVLQNEACGKDVHYNNTMYNVQCTINNYSTSVPWIRDDRYPTSASGVIVLL